MFELLTIKYQGVSKASVTLAIFCNLCCKAIAKTSVRGVTRSNDLCSLQRLGPRILKLRLKSLNCAHVKGLLALQVAKINVTHCYGYGNAIVAKSGAEFYFRQEQKSHVA